MKISRQDFLIRCGRCLFGAAFFFGPFRTGNAGTRGKAAVMEEELSHKQKALQDWLSSMMSGLEERMTRRQTAGLLEECGRVCAGRHARQEALRFRGNMEGWLKRFKEWVGPENISRDENSIRIAYDRCFCPLVKDLSSFESETFCHCSRGWLLEVFSAVTGEAVEVSLEESIIGGGDRCRFTVLIA